MKVAVVVTFLFIFVHGVQANSCQTKYSLSEVCPADYGQWLDDVTGVMTSLSCSELCAANTECLSYMFDAGRCRMNAEEAPTFSQNCATTVVYGLIEKATCRQQWFSEPCYGTCPVPNSHCENNVCTCNVGYAYRRKSGSCVTDCTTYGQTFTHQPGVLLGFDAAIHYEKTFPECFALCVAETSFVCLAVELIPDVEPQTCFLVTETALTQPDYYVASSDNFPHHTYRRNCA